MSHTEGKKQKQKQGRGERMYSCPDGSPPLGTKKHAKCTKTTLLYRKFERW